MGLFSFLFACKDKNINQGRIDLDNVTLEEITSRIDLEEGWNDVFLKMTSDKKTDTSHIYIAKGLYEGKVVGIEIEVNSNIKAGFQEGQMDGSGWAAKGVKIGSIGPESDEFVRALSTLYGQSSTNGFTNQEITATVFSLNDRPVNLDEPDYYKLKVFLNENSEELYSELYLNINTAKGEIELNEKDEEYRGSIIKNFEM